ncbi:hypothetical protein HDU86_002067 [Geranomyces michiganensis]|nr:hypothetical protein HDU86_002067 [Geranomyces michiganensis]
MDVEAARAGPIPHLGFFDSLCITVGTVVGIGIFGNPQSAYLELGSIGLTLVLWVFGGVLTIAGAFCYAELGTAMTGSGGEHNYLMKAFGPYAAYAFDWSQSLLSWPLSNAAVATIASQYIAKLILMDTSLTPDEQPAPATWITRLISVIIIVTLTLVNCVSSRFVAKVQRFLTIIKFGALLLVAGIGIYYIVTNSPGNFQEPFKGSATSVRSLGAGLTAILFSYGGFNNLGYRTLSVSKECARCYGTTTLLRWLTMAQVLEGEKMLCLEKPGSNYCNHYVAPLAHNKESSCRVGKCCAM